MRVRVRGRGPPVVTADGGTDSGAGRGGDGGPRACGGVGSHGPRAARGRLAVAVRRPTSAWRGGVAPPTTPVSAEPVGPRRVALRPTVGAERRHSMDAARPR